MCSHLETDRIWTLICKSEFLISSTKTEQIRTYSKNRLNSDHLVRLTFMNLMSEDQLQNKLLERCEPHDMRNTKLKISKLCSEVGSKVSQGGVCTNRINFS